MIQHLTRRGFLKGVAAAAVAAPILVRASSVGAGERPAPSNRIAMGAIGLGGMGSGDLGDFLGRSEVQMIATCDADIGRAEKAKKHVEQVYAGKAERGDFKGCAATQDFREVLANPAIDAVMIATPDHWHAIPVIMAARAGKDIHCQKPLSLTVPQGRAMVDAVTRYGRVFQTGSQQRSDRNFRYACELVRNGRVGKLLTMEVGLPGGSQCPPQPEKPVPAGFDYNLWLGPAPRARIATSGPTGTSGGSSTIPAARSPTGAPTIATSPSGATERATRAPRKSRASASSRATDSGTRRSTTASCSRIRAASR